MGLYIALLAQVDIVQPRATTQSLGKGHSHNSVRCCLIVALKQERRDFDEQRPADRRPDGLALATSKSSARSARVFAPYTQSYK